MTDLPTGWSSQEPSSSKGGNLCNKGSVNKAVPPAAKTEVQFVNGSESPLFYEQLLSYSDDATAGRALDKFQSNATACTSFKQSGVKIEIGQLSAPPLGDRSVAYRLTFTQNDQSAVGDTQVIRRGPVLIYVAYLDLSPDTQQMATFAKLAYDKAINVLHLR
jgi:hypothetical protein